MTFDVFEDYSGVNGAKDLKDLHLYINLGEKEVTGDDALELPRGLKAQQ
jgi:hypothetical protein